MLHLTPKQQKTLSALVYGTTEKQDGRSMQALERKGYVKNGIATTRGWHCVGLVRYPPQIRVPMQWEVDTWKNTLLCLKEGPNSNVDEGDNVRWHIAEHVQYYLDFHKVMQFYRSCKQAEELYVKREWTESDDLEYELEKKFGWRNNRFQKHDFITGRAVKKAHIQVEEQYGVSYTSYLLYSIADRFFKRLLAPAQIYSLSTTFKYSFQDNEDELSQFMVDTRTYTGPLYITSVTVD